MVEDLLFSESDSEGGRGDTLKKVFLHAIHLL